MTSRNQWFDEFQRNLSDLIAKSPAGDIERNVKALMAQTFTRLDLVTREELEVQQELLERALQRLTVLEQRLASLETGTDTRHGSATEATPANPRKPDAPGPGE